MRRGRHNVRVMPGSSLTKGRLLVATPPLEDPNFDRTVIYVLEHHDEGALGLVLNRPSPEQLGEPLDGWVDLQTDPSLVFSGGPVETDALIALARTSQPLDDAGDHLAPLSGDIASADLAADPALVVSSIDALRVFRGYSGWGPGQLEDEIEAGAWMVLDPDPSDLFTSDPGDLWRHVLRRQPGRLSWLAEAPDDLIAN
jgi:putative transcriptional regulator